MSDFDISALSEEQQLALQQYTSVTDQDLAAAVPLLQKCQWNTQIAITRFFDGDADTVDPVAEAARAPPPPPATSRRQETLMDTIPTRHSTRSARRGLEPAPRVVPTPENQISQPMPFPFNILFLPFNLTYTIFQRLFGTIGYLFPFLPRLLNRLYSGRALQPSRDTGRRPLNPTDTAARFMREFEEEYGVTHGTLPFHESGYAQAFDLAKRDLKHLLVVLLSPEHDDTAPFVRDTLLTPDLIEYIKEPANNIVLWAGTVQDAEAYQVANALNVTRFPFVSLIAHTPSVSSTAMSKIASSAGPVTSQDLISKFTTAISAHKEELDRLRAQRQEQQLNRSLRQEQESAYERSLAQDREKARKRKEEEAEKEKSEREERERAERKADLARKLAQWRRWRAQSIPEEPGAEFKEVVRVSVRLPSGERVVRKFAAEAELEELYAFVECYDLLGEDAVVEEKEVQEPEGYEHMYKFQLVSPMPREVYDLNKTGSLRERIGRSANLIVEKVVGEDDEEDEEDEDRKFSITSETAFAHPAEAIFDFVSNPANWGRTYSGSGGVHENLTLPLKFGDTWMEEVSLPNNTYYSTWTLITVERPRKFVFQQKNDIARTDEQGTGSVRGFTTISYTFEPDVGHGVTLFTRNLTCELPKGVGIPDDLLTVCCRPDGIDRYHAAVERELDERFGVKRVGG